MSRRYVDTLLTLVTATCSIAGMYFWAGFEQVGVKITRTSRKGRPAYTVFRRFQLMVRAISAFSSLPLQMSFWVGLTIALGCVGYGIVLLARKIANPDAILKRVHDSRVADEPLRGNDHDEPRRDRPYISRNLQPDAEPSRLPDTIGLS
jgi:hypothetical protein